MRSPCCDQAACWVSWISICLHRTTMRAGCRDAPEPTGSGAPGLLTMACACPRSIYRISAATWPSKYVWNGPARCPTCPGCACLTTSSWGASCAEARLYGRGPFHISVGHPPRGTRLPGLPAARLPARVRLRAAIPARRHHRLLGHEPPGHLLVRADEHFRAEGAQARTAWHEGDLRAGQPRRSTTRVCG